MCTKGRCFCGKTQWEFDGDPTWSCYCHCDDCRRNCAAPVVGWLGVPEKDFRWVGQAPKTFQSSPGVTRLFCDSCGTPMGFVAEHYPGGMNLYAATLEDPTQFTPEFHVNYQSKLPWLAMQDDLPKYDSTLLHAPQDLSAYQS